MKSIENFTDAFIAKPITVTSPLLPPLEEFIPYLEDIWKRNWLTNNGYYHQQLEKALCEYLGVKYISLFANGTLALITALQALRVTGEVITTPYSFVATTHSLCWNRIKPVFVDVEPQSLNMDPKRIVAAITPQTTAIMPVHVYGTPCKVEQIQEIADAYNLKVIYDAAHAFGVKLNGNSILNFGDLSILSFHATKIFSTIEGGAIICHDEKMKRHIDDLKNFGFRDEATVVATGINAKLNEVQSAFGLLSLTKIDNAIEHRKWVAEEYKKILRDVEGITYIDNITNVIHNYAYFPIFVDAEVYGLTRDELYFKLKESGVLSRRYFYPLISNFLPYKGLSSASKENLSVANSAADKVICLPMHASLSKEDLHKIISIIK
ncbi:DegT/DnrJ/EryC1/StrS family aminotransferase [uncultured Acetobacteroides sp.]|uniref:DegT/DnrJ/EryC1/StrS family aminotransferase n=1 Tax=uncultured Acetobacteroides sp. TaxID=1760811 RepID=UPI0029F48599|nr:DegT/DnrJ/EryC1/StrS family aminotransferase [uncultured Acetobacteroides sp.]